MNRITKILLTLSVVGVMVVPVITMAACGARPLCDECLTEETCTAKMFCVWDTGEEVCGDQAVITLAPADITTTLGHVSDLFASAKLLILLAVGLPVGFYVIKRVLRLVPVDRKK